MVEGEMSIDHDIRNNTNNVVNSRGKKKTKEEEDEMDETMYSIVSRRPTYSRYGPSLLVGTFPKHLSSTHSPHSTHSWSFVSTVSGAWTPTVWMAHGMEARVPSHATHTRLTDCGVVDQSLYAVTQ